MSAPPRPADLAGAPVAGRLLAAGAAVRQEFSREWRATALHAASLRGPRAQGFAATARDFRPADAERGRGVLLGRFEFGGLRLEVGVGGDPWNRPSPSRAFAVQLHRFAWLPDLLTQGEAGATEGLRLYLLWRRLFQRISPFAWSAEVLERRVFNLACGLRRLGERASEAETQAALELLLRQARELLDLKAGPARRAERCAAAALVGAVAAGPAGERLLARALPRLARALEAAVLADGVLKTRAPEQGLELLFDLLALDDALLQRGRETPEPVAHALDRLAGAVAAFRGEDGRLASFHGGGASTAERVRAASPDEDGAGRPMNQLPHGGYERLAGRSVQVWADAAVAPPGAWSAAACGAPLAIEIVCGPDRLVVNSGWTPDSGAAEALRLAQAASTAVLGERSLGAPLARWRGRALGPRLIGGPRRVEARRHESETAVWLELSHDGWVETYGLVHERRLYLDLLTDELRGEERFTPAQSVRPVKARRAPVTVRFHLHPNAKVSLARDQRSVLLRGPSNRGWWFRNDAETVELEPSVHIEASVARRSAQVVLRATFDPAEGGRVRWKLAPVEPDR